MEAQYLRVTNFEQYQHYKDRRPVWIKLHISLLDSYDLNKLDYPTRLLAQLLLLVAATHDNYIPYDPAYVAGKVAMAERVVAKCLPILVQERFLTLARRKHSASKVLAKRSTSASPEKRREEREKNNPKGLFVASNDTSTAPGEIPRLIDDSLRGAA